VTENDAFSVQLFIDSRYIIDSISKKSDFRKDKSGNNPDQCETCYRKNLLIIGTSHKVNLIQIFGRGVEVYIDNQLP
jgi:hypothetical protein